MIETARLLKEKKLAAKLLLTVHDELVFELPPHETEDLKEILKSSMEKIIELDVPLKINIAWGKNWSEAH
jgi:DNA polymerase-1